MTTPDTTAPACTHQHGTRHMYRDRKCHTPCRCAPCVAAYRRARAAYNAEIKAGRPAFVPAEPVRQQIEEWRRQGVSLYALAKQTKIAERYLTYVARGQRTRILAVMADAIMSATPTPCLVSPVKPMRQLRALAVAGFTFAAIGAAIGTAQPNVSRIAVGRQPSITPDLAGRIDAFFERWYAEDGPNKLARTRAINKGWYPAEAWTDETIGNPEARPWGHLTPISSHEYVDWARVWQIVSGYRRYTADETTVAEREEAVARLHSWGRNDLEIARVTDWSERTVLRIRQRLGLPAIEQFTVYARPSRDLGEAAA